MRKISTLIFIVTSILFSSCSNKEYGEELSKDGVQLFYTDKVTKEEANNLLSYLVEEGFSDGTTKTVQLNKSGNTYEFRMVVKKGIEQDEEYITLFKDLTLELSESVFNYNPVDIHLCDDELETIRIIPMYQNNLNHKNRKAKDINLNRRTNKSQNKYPEIITTNFMEGCLEEGNVDLCECMLEKIEANYTLDEFIEIADQMERNITSDETREFMNKIALDCVELSY